MSDDLVEKIANAIYEAGCSSRGRSWLELCDLAGRDGYLVAKTKREQCLAMARAAIVAIEAHASRGKQ